MRYKITENVIEFIKASIGSERGANADLGRRSGLRSQQISAMLHGKYPMVQEDTWLRLCSAVPGLSELGVPADTMGDRQRPIAVATVHGDHSNATAIAGSAIGEYRLRVQDRLLSAGIDAETLRVVLDIMREEASR